MRIEFELENTENVGDLSTVELQKIGEIFHALVVCGGLTGVKAGQTIIHFDHKGVFKHIELKYTPWSKMRELDNSPDKSKIKLS